MGKKRFAAFLVFKTLERFEVVARNLRKVFLFDQLVAKDFEGARKFFRVFNLSTKSDGALHWGGIGGEIVPFALLV